MARPERSFTKFRAAAKPLSPRSFLSLGRLKDDRPSPGTALLFGRDVNRHQPTKADAGRRDAATVKQRSFFTQSASETNPLNGPRGSTTAEPGLAYSDVPLPYPDIPFQPSLRRSYWRAQGQPLSIYNLGEDRQDIIMDDSPATFEILDNPSLDPPESLDPISRFIGRRAVRENESFIESAADRYGVDADLIRAIMYHENSAAYYDSFTFPSWRRTIRPMNIYTAQWSALLRGRDIHDPATNIDIGAEIIRGFMDRLDRPTAAAIGSLWVFAGRELVSESGASIAQIYEQRPWE